MTKFTRISILLLLLIAGMIGCTPYRKTVMFQPSAQDTLPNRIDETYRPIIQPNDILDIYVTSTSPEASKYFNYSESPENTGGGLLNSYLVDLHGEIQTPLIGSVKVSGLNSAYARDTISKRLSRYLVNPSVKLSIRNFKVTILGEVVHPGIYTVQNEKLTLPEAIALAGDLTIFSKRDQVMIIRDSVGFKTFLKIDLGNRSIFSTPAYSLHSNDIVYIEPNKKKRFLGENYYRVFPVILGSVTFLLSIIQLTKK